MGYLFEFDSEGDCTAFFREARNELDAEGIGPNEVELARASRARAATSTALWYSGRDEPGDWRERLEALAKEHGGEMHRVLTHPTDTAE